MFGEKKNDALRARAQTMAAIGGSYIYGSADVLREHGVELIAEKPLKVLELLPQLAS